jgi:hypothetical protein
MPKVVEIVYTSGCAEIEPDPCIHDNVMLKYSDGTTDDLGEIDGVKIAKLYQKHSLKVPTHFESYLIDAE